MQGTCASRGAISAGAPLLPAESRVLPAVEQLVEAPSMPGLPVLVPPTPDCGLRLPTAAPMVGRVS